MTSYIQHKLLYYETFYIQTAAIRRQEGREAGTVTSYIQHKLLYYETVYIQTAAIRRQEGGGDCDKLHPAQTFIL